MDLAQTPTWPVVQEPGLGRFRVLMNLFESSKFIVAPTHLFVTVPARRPKSVSEAAWGTLSPQLKAEAAAALKMAYAPVFKGQFLLAIVFTALMYLSVLHISFAQHLSGKKVFLRQHGTRSVHNKRPTQKQLITNSIRLDLESKPLTCLTRKS